MCVCCLTEAWELWAFYKARCDFKNTNKLNIKQKLQQKNRKNQIQREFVVYKNKNRNNSNKQLQG